MSGPTITTPANPSDLPSNILINPVTNPNASVSGMAKTPVPGPGPGQIPGQIVASSSLPAGTVIVTPSPYCCPHAAAAAGATKPITRGTFSPETPRVNYGRYEAIPRDVSQIEPAVIVKKAQDQKGWTLFQRNGVDAVTRSGPVTVQSDWMKEVETEYYHDTATKRPTAVVFKRVADERFRIINSDELVKTTFKNAPVYKPPPAGPNPSINQMSTRKAKVVAQARPAKGWTEYVDSALPLHYYDHKNMHSLGWRLVKLASTITKAPMFGVMQLLSFHGVLGSRVWAPSEPGRWEKWVSRGFNPYMGQTSLGK